ncbi:imidazolonepropionase-like domain-containing protein [Streptomyces purpureus]|uniref:Aminodeoxyfutalosine deaminase/Imidazolonepropionase-like composite domain-containing protein n=1 Tax=Streptomyces purpureus TaxID=1951 RepID=A0A918H1L2_9ACTN|nr:hypothetical protein [Streptomyces purpureus]GGT31432.1 hypothetical protein GCM10014713_26150 [Streptomyces purpureus]
MLTLHTADLLLPVGGEPVPGGAVLVDGDRIAAFGPREELTAGHPAARVRAWPGVLTPGLRQWHAVWLLRRCYFPDPREAGELGTEMLRPESLGDLAAELERDPGRRAGSVRRGLQQMLRHGTTAVAIRAGDPLLAAPAARLGLEAVSYVGGPGILLDGPSLDPFVEGHDLAGSVHRPLTPGGRADFAVFDAPDEAALLERGAACCMATVLAGRLVHRRR